MEWVIVVVLAYFLFFKKSSTVNNNFTVTGGGGTSTPTPTPQMPAFYQESNSAPTSADNPRPPVTVSPNFAIIKSPTPDISTNTEQSSNSSEQNTSYINNGLYTAPPVAQPVSNLIRVGVFSSGPLQNPNPPFTNPIVIPKTIDSPTSVGTPPAGSGLTPAASIAPNPQPNPTFEATVPQIASAVVKASLTQDNSTSLLRQRAFV